MRLQGLLITVCPPASIFIWNFQGDTPLLAQSITLKYETISTACLQPGSDWLHVGTEKGNVLFFNSTNCVRSSYDIMWNKACCGDYKTRPGPVVILEPHPVDASKLLLGFESGLLILWDYMEKAPVVKYDTRRTGEVLCCAWAPDGQTFATGHGDGTLKMWREKERKHLAAGEDDLSCQLCEPISWIASFHDGTKPMFLHNGGATPLDPSIHYFTVAYGNAVTKLEMRDAVECAVCTTASPWGSKDLPSSVVMITGNHIDVYDTQQQPGQPGPAATAAARIIAPHALELQHSDICCTTLIRDCPRALISALKGAGAGAARAAAARWAASGGTAPQHIGAASQHTLAVTGHADGTVHFWSYEEETLGLLYVLPPPPFADFDQHTTAAINVDLCCPSRQLSVAYANGAVVLHAFASTRRHASFARVQGVLPVASVRDLGKQPKKEITPEMVTTVAAMGFSDEAAMQALIATNADVNLATMQLFNDDLNVQDDRAKDATKPALHLGGGADLGQESSSDANCGTVPLTTEYDAPAGFQVSLVCKCAFRDKPDKPIENVVAMAYSSGWDCIAFSVGQGVCLVNAATSPQPRARGIALAELQAMKKAKFKTPVSVPAQGFPPHDEDVTTLAFAGAASGQNCVKSLWLGTSSGHVFTVSLAKYARNETAASPFSLNAADCITGLDFVDAASQPWSPVPKRYVPPSGNGTTLLTIPPATVHNTTHSAAAPARPARPPAPTPATRPDLERYCIIENSGDKVPLGAHYLIERAWYGDPNFEFQQGHGIDVTARAKIMIKDFDLVADNETWGDPKPGVLKMLVIEYRSGAQAPVAEVADGPPPPYSAHDPEGSVNPHSTDASAAASATAADAAGAGLAPVRAAPSGSAEYCMFREKILSCSTARDIDLVGNVIREVVDNGAKMQTGEVEALRTLYAERLASISGGPVVEAATVELPTNAAPENADAATSSPDLLPAAAANHGVYVAAGNVIHLFVGSSRKKRSSVLKHGIVASRLIEIPGNGGRRKLVLLSSPFSGLPPPLSSLSPPSCLP